MKKLKLSLIGIEGVEVLSRDQLKKISGGDSFAADCRTFGCPNEDQICEMIYVGGSDGNGNNGIPYIWQCTKIFNPVPPCNYDWECPSGTYCSNGSCW